MQEVHFEGYDGIRFIELALFLSSVDMKLLFQNFIIN